jgi:hypothetical protein
MRPPRSTLGVVGTGVAVVAAGAVVGTGAGYAAAKAQGTAGNISGTIFILEMGVLGAIAVGFAGIVVAAASPKWREVGEAAAVVGVGAPLVLAAIGVAKQHAQLSQGGGTTPQTYSVTTTDSGSTVNMNVGDTLQVTLPSTDAAPTVSATGTLATSTTTTSGSNQVASFVATAAGTVTVSSGTDFTLQVVVA